MSILSPDRKQRFVWFVNGVMNLMHPRAIHINAWVKIRFGKLIHRNWGDDVNMVLLELISGRPVVVDNESSIHLCVKKNYISIGSIIGLYENRASVIWGAGFIDHNMVLREKPDKVVSVRGPLTRECLLLQGVDCPIRYGDPVLLISRYYKPKCSVNRFSLGIVIHFSDREHPVIRQLQSDNRPDITIIDMSQYDDWTDIPDRICSCSRIISSSLHGMIVADSYGIPNMWVRFYGLKKGGFFTFLDYLESVQRDVASPVDIRCVDDVFDMMNTGRVFENYHCPVIDFEGIINSCPFIR